MQRIYQMIDCAAASRATVFISGESGTGKEVCAEAIHTRSDRSNKPFIAINCSAIPKDLIESEIFGHVKGAFTGAVSERDGAAKAAHGGTLFLDEICEMELALQSKLLRFLQTSTLQKVGSDRTETVDVRIVCASNKDPWAQVQAGEFRDDLYYRLHVLPIKLPPLRERDNDVIEIASHFLRQYCVEEQKDFTGFDPETELLLNSYDWPGNVRQLQNVVRNIVVLHNGNSVTPQMLPPPLDSLSQGVALNTMHQTAQMPAQAAAVNTIPGTAPSQQPAQMTPPATHSSGSLEDQIRPLAEVERELIEHAIELCAGNIPTAAHYLGISAATIYRKRNQWKG